MESAKEAAARREADFEAELQKAHRRRARRLRHLPAARRRRPAT